MCSSSFFLHCITSYLLDSLYGLGEMSERRTHIAKEVLSTERTFVKQLKCIVDVCGDAIHLEIGIC